MDIRKAKENDISQIRELFVSEYGEDYPFQEFYDTEWLKRGIFSDTSNFFVAEENNIILGTGTVLFAAGDYDDLVGEFGRAVVRKDKRSNKVASNLMTEAIQSVEKVIQFGFAENRTTHNASQKLCENHGMVQLGFEPKKYVLKDKRESVVLQGKIFGLAAELRRNNPHVTANIYPLAVKCLENLGLPSDPIVEDEVRSYLSDKKYEVEELEETGITPLLRIERGRVKNREVFGNLSLTYGFFKIAANASVYLVAKEGGITVGAIGFTVDRIDKKIKILELIAFENTVKGFLLSRLDQLAQERYGADYIEIDISAYSPRIQKTLDQLGFFPVAYCPSMVFQDVERLDVVRMAKLHVPLEDEDLVLTEKSQIIYEIVDRALMDRKVGVRIAEVTKEVDIFKGLAEGELHRLARICRPVYFKKDRIIIQEGESRDRMFVLIDGEARVTKLRKGKEVTIGAINEGEIFGELSLIDNSPRSATVVTKEDSTLLAISLKDFHNLINKEHHLGMVVMRNIAQGLSEKLRRTDELLITSKTRK